mgnify:CR=1 FL=1
MARDDLEGDSSITALSASGPGLGTRWTRLVGVRIRPVYFLGIATPVLDDLADLLEGRLGDLAHTDHPKREPRFFG